MHDFEFKVTEYFKLSNNHICMVGYMYPDNVGIITSEYKITLITASGKKHNFDLIGEEIFARSKPRTNNKRALRTTDDVARYFENLSADPVKLVGHLIASENVVKGNFSKQWK